MTEIPEKIDWVPGDALGLEIPAHQEALLAGGAEFLTQAFRVSGALSADNEVVSISEHNEVFGGSTGRKLLLKIQYKNPDPGLHTDLFVKFSRDFADDHRDQARVQMELEVLFALISRDPNFPIAVPQCYFTDFHNASGTGILITQCIPYGMNGVEPQYPKCLDHQMPDPLGHYRALISALGRLAGAHKAGRLSSDVAQYFPFDPAKLVVSQRASYTPEQISRRVEGLAEFVGDFPQLFPESLRSPEFLNRLADEAPRFQALEAVVKQVLQSESDMIALCHWNAHVDNAWFWRTPSGELACGLMDWGNVSQMNVAMALWGCLSAAEVSLWDEHLDELLSLFITEFEGAGGSSLNIDTLKRHLTLYVGMMGLAWMLDSPQLIRKRVPELADTKDRFDSRIQASERARSQLLILIDFLNLWEKQDMNQVIGFLETRASNS